MKKTSVLEILNSFEDEFDTEKFIERLLFVEKVEKGLQDVAETKSMNYQDIKERFREKWVK